MSDIPGQPNLSQLAEAVIEATSEQIRAAIPGIFVDVSNDLRSGSVQPSISRPGSSPDPAIPDVPILYPGGSGASISWTVASGDPCLLVVSDRDLDSWVRNGGTSRSSAVDPRTHDLSDAVAIPVAIPSGARADGTIRINAGSGGRVAIGTGSAELVSLASQVCDAFIQNAANIGTGVAPGAPIIMSPAIVTLLTAIKAGLDSIKGAM